MNLAAWAERNGVARVTAYRWFCAGLLAVGAQRVGRGIVVEGSSAGPAARPALTAVYARVSSADQRLDLDRQVAGVTAWATAQLIAVDKVVTEVGSALNGHRRKFLGCFVIGQCSGSWWDTGIGFVASALNMSKLHWLPRAASCSWSMQLRSMTTWCGI
jgi:predicted site-specific integrase-resolvase